MLTKKAADSFETIMSLWQNKHVLLAITKSELKKKYAGSVLGASWLFIYPACLLSIYLFVYMVVFQMRLPDKTPMEYVIYVFAGLIPYIGFMEAVNIGTGSIRSNFHLIKNVMLPIDLVPVRAVTVSMVSQLVSLTILSFMVFFEIGLSYHVLWLPLVLVIQFLFLLGLVWILSALAVLLPDLLQVVSLLTLMLIFLTPIGFTPDMVPAALMLIVDINPLYYLIELFRYSLVYQELPPVNLILINLGLCFGSAFGGAWFFSSIKEILVDYE